MTRRLRRLLASLLPITAVGLLLQASPTPANAAADVVYEQLNDGQWVTAQGSTFLAQSFTTGASSSSLTDVSIWFRNANVSDSGSVPSSYSVGVWSDSGSGPSAQLSSVASNVSVASWSDNVSGYSLATPLSLAANTRYFVVVTGSSGGTFSWKCSAASPATTVSPTPTFVALTSTNSGSSWSSVGGNCAGKNFGMKVTTAVAVAPTFTGFAGLSATVGDAPVAIVAPVANTAGTFAYSSSNPSVVSISGGNYTFVGPGTSTITATFTPTDTLNYTTATATMTISVVAAATTTTSTTTTSSTTSTAAPTTTAPVVTAPTTVTTRPRTTVPAATTTSSTTSPTTTVASTTSTTSPRPTSTTSSTTTTVVTSVAPSTTIAPASAGDSPSPFGDDEAESLAVTIEADSGDPSGGAPIMVRASALMPGSDVVVTVYSDPIVLLTGKVDEFGNFEAIANLPSGLEPGSHVLIVTGTGPTGEVEVAGTFTLDDSAAFERIVQPRALTALDGPADARLERALELNRPVWDPASRPLTTGAIVVAATSLIALAGAGGLARGMSTGSSATVASSDSDGQRRRNSRGKLASVVTKKLKGIQVSSTSWGDLSGTWARPGTERADRFSQETPARLGRWSAAASRVFVDGAWLRAILGSFGFAPWLVGMALGVITSFAGTESPLTPMAAWLTVIVVLGILDAGIGACAWLTILVLALVTGSFGGWPDVRTALGLGILLATPSLLAHVIRPLRRYVASNSFETWERAIDYVIVPVFVAFATGSMLKALNGLSGLEIVGTSDISILRWAAGLAIIARLAFEDVAAHLYPERMKLVQPAKLVSPSRSVAGVSITIRSLVFLMVCEPFFGVTANTVAAAVVLAIPVVLKLWEDDLPDYTVVHKWLPRGLFRFLCTLIIGTYLTMTLIGADGGESEVRSSLVWLLLPGSIIGVAELFGRSGGNWPNVAVRRTLGAVVWVTAVAIVTGQLTLFA